MVTISNNMREIVYSTYQNQQ